MSKGSDGGGMDNHTEITMINAPQPAAQNDATFRSHRVLPYQPPVVFDAFARPERLTQWWGPNGFTNTFEAFEFRPWGRWKFVMHGPDDSNHPNECVFLELQAPSRLVIQHVGFLKGTGYNGLTESRVVGHIAGLGCGKRG